MEEDDATTKNANVNTNFIVIEDKTTNVVHELERKVKLLTDALFRFNALVGRHQIEMEFGNMNVDSNLDGERDDRLQELEERLKLQQNTIESLTTRLVDKERTEGSYRFEAKINGDLARKYRSQILEKDIAIKYLRRKNHRLNDEMRSMKTQLDEKREELEMERIAAESATLVNNALSMTTQRGQARPSYPVSTQTDLAWFDALEKINARVSITVQRCIRPRSYSPFIFLNRKCVGAVIVFKIRDKYSSRRSMIFRLIKRVLGMGFESRQMEWISNLRLLEWVLSQGHWNGFVSSPWEWILSEGHWEWI